MLSHYIFQGRYQAMNSMNNLTSLTAAGSSVKIALPELELLFC